MAVLHRSRAFASATNSSHALDGPWSAACLRERPGGGASARRSAFCCATRREVWGADGGGVLHRELCEPRLASERIIATDCTSAAGQKVLVQQHAHRPKRTDRRRGQKRLTRAAQVPLKVQEHACGQVRELPRREPLQRVMGGRALRAVGLRVEQQHSSVSQRYSVVRVPREWHEGRGPAMQHPAMYRASRACLLKPAASCSAKIVTSEPAGIF
jgi:hypothetical protein